MPRQNDENEEDPAEELARALLEYKRAKEASSKLGGLYSQFSGRFEKDTDEISPDRTYVADHNVNLLSSALLSIMSNIEVSDEVASEKIKPLISTKTVSVGEKVFAVLRILVTSGGHVNVIECFEGIRTKHEAVATFMALLEMLRAGRITLEESDTTAEGVINLENNVYINLFTGKIRGASEENNG